jgi:FixJ family two-component response regulator
LEAEGYRPDVYESLGEFRSAEKLPQAGCAVLDLNLPDGTGLDIQQELARSAPALSIVFLTAFGQVTSGVQAMKGGAVDFLEKPAQDAVLLEAVRRALDRSQRLWEGQLEPDELARRLGRLRTRESEVFRFNHRGSSQ